MLTSTNGRRWILLLGNQTMPILINYFYNSKLFDWSEGKDRPPNGSLVQLVTTNGTTEFINT